MKRSLKKEKKTLVWGCVLSQNLSYRVTPGAKGYTLSLIFFLFAGRVCE